MVTLRHLKDRELKIDVGPAPVKTYIQPLVIDTCPIHVDYPYTGIFSNEGQKIEFYGFGYDISSLICELQSKFDEGYQVLKLNQPYNFTALKLESEESFRHRLELEERKFNDAVKQFELDKKAALVKLEEQYQAKLISKAAVKTCNDEKYNDPEYIEFLRMKDKMKARGYI